MRDRLKAEAEANKRSMNAEIVARLQTTLDGTQEAVEIKRLDALEKINASHDAFLEIQEGFRLELDKLRMARLQIEASEYSEIYRFMDSLRGQMSIDEIKSIVAKIRQEVQSRKK